MNECLLCDITEGVKDCPACEEPFCTIHLDRVRHACPVGADDDD